jgi:hypothetical protein
MDEAPPGPSPPLLPARKCNASAWEGRIEVRMVERWLPPYLSSRVWRAFLDCNSHGRAKGNTSALEIVKIPLDWLVNYGHDC